MIALLAALAATLAAPQAHGAGHGAPPVRQVTPAACTPEHAAMGHCTMPAQPAAAPPAAACTPEHAAMGHCTMPAPPPATACTPEHAAMGHCTLPATPPPRVGNAPAPAIPRADYADRIWGADAMAPARAALHREHGGMTFSLLMVDLAEVAVRDGSASARWDAEYWWGGDVDRLTLKTEGEGVGRGGTGGEVQALYSRAIGPYFNLQAGARQDLGRGPDRRYAVVGVEGLAPYWFKVEGALFLSDRGDAFARVEGYYDQRITQRLILQPRGELNLAAQDVAESGIAGGISGAELGLRLRYEIVREFAPYAGLNWERRFGDAGDGGLHFVAGVRAWF